MDFWHEITAPANTPMASPIREVMEACPGVVKEVMLAFPKGHRGYMRVRILRFEHPLWPSTPDAWYRGDGWLIEFPENHPMGPKPHYFMLEAYNLDPDDGHTAMIRITILEEQRRAVFVPPVPIFEGMP